MKIFLILNESIGRRFLSSLNYDYIEISGISVNKKSNDFDYFLKYSKKNIEFYVDFETLNSLYGGKSVGEFKNGSYTGVGAYVGLEGNWFPISDSYYRDNYHFKELKSSEYIVLSKVEDMTVDEVENYLKEKYPQFTGFE